MVNRDLSRGRRFDVRRKTYQKFQEKNFSKKFVFVLKTLPSRLSIKKSKKKFFSGQNGLQFFAPHRSVFFAIILRWALVDRKMLSGDLVSSKKSVERNTFFLTEKEGKRPKNGHLEPMG